MGLEKEFHPVQKPKHSRRVEKRGERSKFSKFVRDAVKEHFDNRCAECGGNGFHVHHVYPRGRGGRNVFTNALLLCNDCHKAIHADEEKLQGWIELYKKKYGYKFYKDRDDLIQEYHTYDLKEQDKEVERWMKYNDKFKY